MTPAESEDHSAPTEPLGVIVVDKPAGITSHDAVSSVRRSLSTRRVGHVGTLDPMATGLLVMCVGPATRLAEYVVSEPKEYEAEITFGIATDTLDITGRTLEEQDARRLTFEQIARASEQFRGKIEQVPPMVSALHVDGVRLYEIARKGQTVERPPREITIDELELIRFEAGERARLDVRVVCSTGTYIRSLAADLGAAVGVCAALSSLRRTRVGVFGETDAEPLAGPLTVRPIEDAIGAMPRGEVRDEDFDELGMGRPVAVKAPEWGSHPAEGALAFVRAGRSHRCAVCRRVDDLLTPVKVLGVTGGAHRP